MKIVTSARSCSLAVNMATKFSEGNLEWKLKFICFFAVNVRSLKLYFYLQLGSWVQKLEKYNRRQLVHSGAETLSQIIKDIHHLTNCALQAFCHVIQREAHSRDLLSILTR